MGQADASRDTPLLPAFFPVAGWPPGGGRALLPKRRDSGLYGRVGFGCVGGVEQG